MDTRRNTSVGAKGFITGLLALAAFIGPLGQSSPARSQIVVNGADRRQEAMVDWAIRRFRAAGLEVPPLEIDFGSAETGARCTLGGGFYEGGVLDLCTGVSVNAYARRVTLHELSHAWADRALGNAQERGFEQLRGLSNWNDWDRPWDERGGEQVAEIISWGIGEGVFLPTIPDNSPDQLAVSYEYLTGMEPPVLDAAD